MNLYDELQSVLRATWCGAKAKKTERIGDFLQTRQSQMKQNIVTTQQRDEQDRETIKEGISSW